MEPKFLELKKRLGVVNDLQSAAAVLGWDQQTYMPQGGNEARARHMATLARLAHEHLTDDAVGQLLDDLRSYEESLPYDSDEASLLRVAREDYEMASKLPASFVEELSNHQARTFEAWTRARPNNDFASVAGLLEKTLEYSRQYASYFPGYEHIADPLINRADRGMTAASVSAVFKELREQLVPIVKAITSQTPADDSCLNQFYPEDKQLEFGLKVAQRFGYDLQRGRQDKTYHPFETRFSVGDVRITTRVKEHDLGEALFSTLHESGHAMYEQGVSWDLEGTPLASGTSAGVHESQSRLWENIVGRSRGFWQYFYKDLQATFPSQLGNVSLDTFYRAINKVQPSLIRTEADEVTYNLHVMLRFDFELALLEGRMAVRDLPDAWHERLQADLGIAPPDDRDGVLQDIHWYGDLIGGMFQGYTLGNIMSAQFYNAALQAHPEIPDEIARGEFGTLHNWMRTNIYQHGRKFTAPEIIERATGGPLQITPYINYLRQKYGELYSL
jgi:Zn-dependent carboxypeptidase